MTGIQNRTEELRRALMDAGACLVGFANLSCLDSKQTKGYPFSICFALQHDSDAVDGLPCDEPFLAMGATLSERANQLYALTAAFLGRGGYRHTRISSGLSVDQLPDLCEELPQKTIATLAGLGWIGKSSLLVSSDHGPRIRLAAMLTDAPFQADTPVVRSRCSDCDLCVEACPVGAVKGANWSQGVDRSDLLDVRLCNDHLRRGVTTLGRKHVCGLCLKACPIGRQ